MTNSSYNAFNRREFIHRALVGAAFAALPTSAFSLDNPDLQSVLSQIPKMHDENVKRLQDWIALPSIAAENRNYPQGPDYMAQLARDAGFANVEIVPTSGKPGVFGTLDATRILENWYGYGKPIYAPGAGIVLATANDIPENWFEDAKGTKIGHPELPPGKDPKDIGNFVLLDHLNGEYSLLVHMKAGSVTVRPGDRVRQGQVVGRIGCAGDSIFPHLHYSFMDGSEVFKVWGLPAYFSHFRRVLGASSTKVEHGPVDSGDFLESDAVYSDAK